jgi:polyisoprenyl-phosphate glycosyltransferase
MLLSVVVPVYNEEAVLPAFLDRLRPVLDGIEADYELLCIDDGSRDSSSSILMERVEEWPQLRIVRLLRNSGHQAALSAGYEKSSGDYVITIDADLQDPPEVIPRMLESVVANEVDVVYGVRSDRSADSRGKRLTARMYYRLMRRLVGGEVPADAGDFRLVSRRVVDAMAELPPHSRVYRLIIPWYGFPSSTVEYRRDARAAGETKYPLGKMVSLAIDSVTTFSAAPLKLATWVGAVGVLICLAAMAWSVWAWLRDATVPGWTSILATVGLVGAIQLISIGLLGEYLSRLFVGSLGRPTYLVGYDSSAEVVSAVDRSERDHRLPDEAREGL